MKPTALLTSILLSGSLAVAAARDESSAPQHRLKRIEELGVEFSKKVELAAGETNRAVCGPGEFQQLIIHKPKLWWPRNYGSRTSTI